MRERARAHVCMRAGAACFFAHGLVLQVGYHWACSLLGVYRDDTCTYIAGALVRMAVFRAEAWEQKSLLLGTGLSGAGLVRLGFSFSWVKVGPDFVFLGLQGCRQGASRSRQSSR